MHPTSQDGLSTPSTSHHAQAPRVTGTQFKKLFTSATSDITMSPRQNRSPSSSSTSSTRSFLSFTTPHNLHEVLAMSFSSSRNASLRSSFISSRRISSFDMFETEAEKAEFGEQIVGLLEPRPVVGWWGLHEVLEDRIEGVESRRSSLS